MKDAWCCQNCDSTYKGHHFGDDCAQESLAQANKNLAVPWSRAGEPSMFGAQAKTWQLSKPEDQKQEHSSEHSPVSALMLSRGQDTEQVAAGVLSVYRRRAGC